MKKVLVIFVAACIFLQIFAVGNNVYAADPPTYPMLCRGGSNMSFELSHVQNANSQVIRIKFSKGRQGAGQAAIPPGTCTWTDRGMRNDEPDSISFTIDNAFARPIISADGRLLSMRYASSPPSGNNDYRKERTMLQDLINAIREGKNFQFHVYQYKDANPMFNMFIATRIGP
jgi:hypothetical protein